MTSYPRGFSLAKARRAQTFIADAVVQHDLLPKEISRVCGVDVSYSLNKAKAAAVILEYQSLKPVDFALADVHVFFPYVPTLLAFREAYPSTAALKKLRTGFDVMLVDANGRLHPYRAGLASHLGVIMKKPTVGVAKSLLCGEVGSWSEDQAKITDNDEVIGTALKTPNSRRALYISVGNMVSLETGVKIVLETIRGTRVPEPLRIADSLTRER